MTAPDLMHKTVGYRYWRATNREIRLVPPLVSGTDMNIPRWKPGANKAQCYGIEPAIRNIRAEIVMLKRDGPGARVAIHALEEEKSPAKGWPHSVWTLPLEEVEDWERIRARRLERLYSMLGEFREREHVSPEHDCQCGFYSWHSLDSAVSYARPRDCDLLLFSRCTMFGLVVNWGKMEVHSDGVRSQYSQVMALCAVEDAIGEFRDLVPEGHRESYMVEISAVYGVPLLDREGILALGEELGGPVPEALRPDTGLTDRH